MPLLQVFNFLSLLFFFFVCFVQLFVDVFTIKSPSLKTSESWYSKTYWFEQKQLKPDDEWMPTDTVTVHGDRSAGWKCAQNLSSEVSPPGSGFKVDRQLLKVALVRQESREEIKRYLKLAYVFPLRSDPIAFGSRYQPLRAQQSPYR